ncbi:LuxR C-terminal-related transcriptional regulator [Streptomyces luteireticuli]|uniref:LuxR C-terminal-related transcriptional regulator n=1 Tax=Streptomyces luteireticuli TaxID=173858 RepID=UPI003557F986
MREGREAGGGPASGGSGAPGTSGTDPSDPEADAAVWRTRFLNLLDRMPVPTAISTTEGRITGANPALAALWDVTPGRLTGRNLLDLFTPTEGGQLARIDAALKHGRRSRYPVRVRWAAAGTEYEGQLTVEPVSDPGGTSPPLLATLRVDGERPVSAPPGDAGTAVALSPQEARIVELVAAGCTTSVVARAVGLSADGVNYHLVRLTRRLGVPNRTALVARAYTLGLLSPTTWPPMTTKHL